MQHFIAASNTLISGSSCSGKTDLVCRIIKHADSLYTIKPEKVLFAYKHWNSAYDQLERDDSIGIKFINYLPDESELREYIGDAAHTVFVCDDLFSELCKSSFAVDLFTRISHHLRVSTILLMQDLSAGGSRIAGSLARNTHYHCLTSAARNYYILRSLGCQLGDYARLKSAYEQATQEQYGYLLISTHPADDRRQRYKTNILPTDDFCTVYV